MAVRKPATEPAEPAQPATAEQRLDRVEAESAALARAICRLAIRLPGGNATIDRILQHEVGVSIADAGVIVAAAQRTP